MFAGARGAVFTVGVGLAGAPLDREAVGRAEAVADGRTLAEGLVAGVVVGAAVDP